MALGLGWFWFDKAPVPSFEGEVSASGLGASVELERDVFGVLSITASSRSDIAFALGFAHAQDRLFQMDQLRRRPAGELSELLGETHLASDMRMRRHRLRDRAAQTFERLGIEHRSVLSAYSAGVNAGADARGFESAQHRALGVAFAPWLEVDSLLVQMGQTLPLLDEAQSQELAVALFESTVPDDWRAYITAPPALTKSSDDEEVEIGSAFPSAWPEALHEPKNYINPSRHFAQVSAVSGQIADQGHAMLAVDQFAALQYPVPFYRAQWRYSGTDRVVAGATVPGSPLMWLGSNGQLSWVLKLAPLDLSDYVKIETDKESSRYKLDGDWASFIRQESQIKVLDSRPENFVHFETQLGPVVRDANDGKLLVSHWLAQDPMVHNLNLLNMESASSVESGLALADTLGVIGYELVLADSAGAIGWTLAGALPTRSHAGDHIQNAANFAWGDYLATEARPAVSNPDNQRLWTAGRIDHLLPEDHNIGLLYTDNARQSHLAERLIESKRFGRRELWDYHRDNRAEFLRRWHVALRAIVDVSPALEEMRPWVDTWGERAQADSVGFSMVDQFRRQFIQRTLGRLMDASRARGENVWSAIEDWETPAYVLLSRQPPDLVPSGYDSWDAFLTDIAASVMAAHQPYDAHSWGQQHAQFMGFAERDVFERGQELYTDLPLDLDSSEYTPRFRSASNAALMSVLMMPGMDAGGIFTMAGGQTEYAKAPYFQAGHHEWLNGTTAAFYAMEPQWRQRLVPAAQ